MTGVKLGRKERGQGIGSGNRGGVGQGSIKRKSPPTAVTLPLVNFKHVTHPGALRGAQGRSLFQGVRLGSGEPGAYYGSACGGSTDKGERVSAS